MAVKLRKLATYSGGLEQDYPDEYRISFCEVHSFTGAYSPGQTFGLPFGVS
jgi:hypothetical protein